MTEPHAVVLWSVAFEHALSLICAPQRTREGALSWSTPSDEQLRYVRAWADFVTEKARGVTPKDRVDSPRHGLIVPFSIMSSPLAPQPFVPPFVPPFVRPPIPCESRSDEIQQEIASTWGDES